MAPRIARLFVLLILSSGFAGCGQPAVVEHMGGDQGGANLTQLNNFYIRATEKLKRPPKSLQELKAGSKDAGDIEAVLKSPNDAQPYIIVWNVDPISPKGTKAEGPVIIAYEKVGVGGQRWVLTQWGVSKLSAEEFLQANFPAGHHPAR